MSTASMIRSLGLALKVRRDNPHRRTAVGNNAPSLCQIIGSVTFHIVRKPDEPHRIQFELPKSIAQAVAERLADLGPVNNLFTLNLFKDTIIIPSFTEAVSLEEILEMQRDWPFDPEHIPVLAADILAGIFSLHSVSLQRSEFTVKDILLVGRNNTYFFQIAGIEDCTCFNGDEPTNHEDLNSLVRVLRYVEERLEVTRVGWIQELVRHLEGKRTLSRSLLETANQILPRTVEHVHKELEIYIHVVRIFGTTLGKAITLDRKGSK